MSILRVHYREKQRLKAAALQDEQQFLLDTLSRHILNAHSYGVVRGLTISLDSSQSPVVQPGIAIDAQGRELILWQPEPLANQLPGDDAIGVWLVFCGQQFNFPRPGRFPCGPAQYGRSRELAVLRCVPSESEPPDPSGVFLGSVQHSANPEGFNVDLSSVIYAVLYGAGVTNPAKTACLQVGRASGADPNQLLLNITNAAGGATNRVAVDRSGNISVYGDVELSAYRARLLVPMAEDKKFLLVEAAIPGPAGERIAVTSEPPDKRGKNLRFVDIVSGNTEPLRELELSTKKAVRERMADKLTAFNTTSQIVRANWVSAEDVENVPSFQGDDETRLSTSGSSILLADFPPAEVRKAQQLRGCQEPAQKAETAKRVNGLSFLSATLPLVGAPARRIYSVKLDLKDSQREEFRFDLGKRQDQDESKRLSIGTSDEKKGSQFTEWLNANGNCKITLVDQKQEGKQLVVSIKAKGYIEQAPIKADPSDRLFKSLMIAAWLNGLRSAVAISSAVAIGFENVPKPTVGDSWHYDVRITNIGSQTISIEKVLETMTYDGKTVIQSSNYQGSLDVGKNAVVTLNHVDAPDTKSDIALEVIVSGKVANVSWWNAAKTTTTVQHAQAPN